MDRIEPDIEWPAAIQNGLSMDVRGWDAARLRGEVARLHVQHQADALRIADLEARLDAAQVCELKLRAIRVETVGGLGATSGDAGADEVEPARIVDEMGELLQARAAWIAHLELRLAATEVFARRLAGGTFARAERLLTRRRAHPLVDPVWYLMRYDDVRQSGVDPHVHFRRQGDREHRDPNPLFDAAWYLAQNPDVALSKFTAAQHFVKFGIREGRDPHPNFSMNAYWRRQATIKRSRRVFPRYWEDSD